MTHYLDASALAKRYVSEIGSTLVRNVLLSERCATSRISEVEVASAIVRRGRQGAFTSTDRDRALASLSIDLSSLVVVEVTPVITREAMRLLLLYSLRAGDAIQLASCLYLLQQLQESVVFAAFDERLNTAARSEGLKLL